ncbi:hypothetical protein OROHE_002938 [Orobanche hederae]
MEGKLVSCNKAIFFAVIFILAFAQSTSAGKCPYYNEYCDYKPSNWCCPGTECSNSYSGGKCVDDPFKSCKPLGESCGFFDAKCCGKATCTATFYGGECKM